MKLNASMKKAALRSALSAQQKNIMVCDDVTQLDGKTSSAEKMLVNLLPEAKAILIIADKPSQLMLRSVSNLQQVLVTSPTRLTAFEVVAADAIIFTQDSVKSLEARLETAEKAE